MGIRSCFSECTGCLEDCRQDVYHKTFEVNAFRLCTQENFHLSFLPFKRNQGFEDESGFRGLQLTMKKYVKVLKWPIFNKIMGCYTIYFIISVSLTTVNLDLLTELEHFDNVIDDMNDTAVPPVQVMDEKLVDKFVDLVS